MAGDQRSVVGAGQFAGLVISALAEKGIAARGLVRDEVVAANARNTGPGEIAIGDRRDLPSWEASVLGVDGVFPNRPGFLAR
jgi:uncharacterized protein YbjT (DUF2867 family)